ncbi:MAG: hypothetical protein QOI89_3788, partial [Solirubrobacteraceae bacterium]|nr:hypothetical protein [Solirubrobacteraceae bacterium]
MVRISQKINKERVGIDFEILDFLMWPEGSSRPPDAEMLAILFRLRITEQPLQVLMKWT